jgi:hypothetical protein
VSRYVTLLQRHYNRLKFKCGKVKNVSYDAAWKLTVSCCNFCESRYTHTLKSTFLRPYLRYLKNISLNIFLAVTTKADSGGSTDYGLGLRSQVCWDCLFESHRRHERLSLVNIVLSGRRLCN